MQSIAPVRTAGARIAGIDCQQTIPLGGGQTPEGRVILPCVANCARESVPRPNWGVAPRPPFLLSYAHDILDYGEKRCEPLAIVSALVLVTLQFLYRQPFLKVPLSSCG